ncbi:MAG TPA: DUF2336 domain-containing protein [Pseudolabrys sp.]|jgi:hypothetical protein
MAKSSAYPSLDSLVDLACRDGVDIRPTLLRVLTDLYVQKPAHSAEEETQYAELARGLIDAVDATTLAVVADRLSAYPAAPTAILAKLGITSKHPGPQPNAVAKAKPTARTDLLELFFAAKTEERRLILTNLDVSTDAAARRLTPASSEVIRRLENAALQRNPGEFSRMLERALGISRTLAERIARDPTGEPIVVAARALGMTAAVLHRILLFLNPAIGLSVERVYDLAHLYDELAPAAAEQMLTIWRQASSRSRPPHEPVHWDDERRDARSLSTPARYRSDRGRVGQPAHVKTSRN